MMKIPTELERAADWICGVTYAELPADVLALAQAQRIDIVGAMCAGLHTGVGRAVVRMLDDSDSGAVRAFPSGSRRSLLGAVYQHATLASVLELDNFVFGGHTGQAAVGVPLALGQTTAASGEELLVAQVVANEVAGRLGAVMTTGPQHGHMKAYLHRVGAAAASARLLRLDRRQTARALAIALSTPEYPLLPASFSADTKVLCVADPTTAGVRACLLALEGMDAALDLVEHPIGLVRSLSDCYTLPRIWDRLGSSFALRAISFKPVAACAYAVAGAVAAAEIRANEGPRWDPANVDAVDVDTSVLSLTMESFSGSHRAGTVTPVNTNFSTRRTVALALLTGAPSGHHFAEQRFPELARALAPLAERVRLAHDWRFTLGFLRGVDAGIDHPGRPGVYGMTESHATMNRFRAALKSPAALGWHDVRPLLRLDPSDRAYLLRRYAVGLRSRLPFLGGATSRAAYVSREADLSAFAFRASARVRVRTKSGNVFEHEIVQPPGFAGDPQRARIPLEKFRREASGALKDPERLLETLGRATPANVAEMLEALDA